MSRSKTYASVWDAIEQNPAVAANMKLRSELMMALSEVIGKWQGTQGDAAKRLGITQPRLNDLVRSKIDKFSLDALITLAHAAGLTVRVKISKAA